MEQIYNSSELSAIFEKVLSDYPIRQGIVGVYVQPDVLGTVEHYEFLDGLYRINEVLNYDIQQVILPPPASHHFVISDNEKMDALRRRVERDQLDGIRYNRVYFAIYTEQPPESVIKAHDIWFDVEEGMDYPSRAVVTDYREPTYTHIGLNSAGEPIIKDQRGTEIKLTAEDLIPTPVTFGNFFGNPPAASKTIFTNSMKETVKRVVYANSPSIDGKVPSILFNRESLIKRGDCINPAILVPPSMSGILKGCFGFNKPDSHIQLAMMMDYNETIAKGILDDKYPYLLTTMIHDIARGIGIDFDSLHQAYKDHIKYRDNKEK